MSVSPSKEPSLAILSLLISFASVSAVLFTPALPEIAKSLNITSSQAQLMMTIFLIGYAFGNLPYGAFSNRFGRKPALYVGILLAIVGSILIVIAGEWHLFWLIIVGRFIEALGSSVGMKITFTMIGDLYSQTKATKKISYLGLSFAIAPGLAIAIGGALTNKFGWQSCFYFLTVYSVLLLFLSTLLPETCQELDLEALNFSTIKAGFLQKLKNKKLIICALFMGCVTAFVYLFASEAPFVGIDHIGLKENEYGVLNFIPPIGMIIGLLCSHQLAGKKEILSILMLGITIALIGTFVMLFLFLMGIVTWWSLFIPVPFIYIGLFVIFSNASGLAMAHAKNKSNASAVMNFINMGVAVVALLAIGFIPAHKPYILPLSFLILGCIMLVLRFFLKNLLSQDTSK